MNSIQSIIEEKIKRFLQSRGRPAETPEKVRQALRSLDVFYWKKTEGLIKETLSKNSQKIELNSEERLLVDAGVVSRRFTELKSSFFEILSKELEIEIPENIFYLSEWLQHRWELSAAIDTVEETVPEQEKSFREDLRYITAHESRVESIKKLQHLIRGLPGISPSSFDMLVSGRMMMHLEDVLFDEIHSNIPASESNQKLRQYSVGVCKRLQERCLTHQHQKIFIEWMTREDQIRKLIKDSVRDEQVSTQIKHENIKVSSTNHTSTLKNLHLIRSLIPLGVTSSAVEIPFSPFFSDTNRCTKSTVIRLIKGLREVDPLLPGDPDILIAPFCGNGFFEWDHNTLILPLTTEHSQNMAFVNAVAGYRIMTDALNFNGQLREAWIKVFGPENFKERFVDAYHNWILGIGYGRHHAMGHEEFRFFLEHIGPNPRRGIGPGELLKLDNESQINHLKECRSKINSGQATLQDVYGAAVIHWMRHGTRDALEAMEQSFAMDPNDPRIHFSMAYLRERVKQTNESANYKEIIHKYPRTLWKVYSEMQLSEHSL